MATFYFSFFYYGPGVISVFTPTVTGYVFCVLLKLFLVSGFASISSSVRKYGALPATSIRCFSKTRRDLSKTSNERYRRGKRSTGCGYLTSTNYVKGAFSLQRTSYSGLLELGPSFVTTGITEALGALLPRRGAASFPFAFRPRGVSCECCMCALEHVLV